MLCRVSNTLALLTPELMQDDPLLEAVREQMSCLAKVRRVLAKLMM